MQSPSEFCFLIFVCVYTILCLFPFQDIDLSTHMSSDRRHMWNMVSTATCVSISAKQATSSISGHIAIAVKSCADLNVHALFNWEIERQHMLNMCLYVCVFVPCWQQDYSESQIKSQWSKMWHQPLRCPYNDRVWKGLNAVGLSPIASASLAYSQSNWTAGRHV